MSYKSDIEIAQSCEKRKITEIAALAGIDERYLEQYGSYKAKVDLGLLRDLADRPDGKLVLEDPAYCAECAFGIGNWIETLDKYTAQ